MLARNTYETAYVEACRAKVAAQVAGFRRSTAAAGFEPLFLDAMVLELDAFFMHRTRALEGKDGNPINEVRMLSHAILNGGVLAIDKTIKYDPARSVLGLKIGEPVRLDLKGFEALVEGYFREIGTRFAP